MEYDGASPKQQTLGGLIQMASAEYAPLLAMYEGLSSKVKELDEILDAASDQKGAGRRAVINQLVSARQDTVDSVVAQFVNQLTNRYDENGNMVLDDSGDPVENDPEWKYGVYFGVLRGLKSTFDESGIAFADSLVEVRPQVQVDPAEVTLANNERSDKVGQMKHLKAILEAVAPEEAAELKVPRRRSPGGPRGKRAISYYTWTVDGADAGDNLTTIGKQLGYGRPADLRDEMKAANINLTKPADKIEFTTNGGHNLIGIKDPDAPSWEDVDESDEDDDEEETEEVSELSNV